MDDKKMTPPEEHRLEAELKVCDPEKTDHTRTMEDWRIEKMSEELVEGFKFLRNYKLAATFFGSARTTMEPQVYEDAEKLSSLLSRAGFTIITGGAGGIMEAGNKGAYDAGGPSVGLNIRLQHEQGGNKYTTAAMTFNYFFTRRVMLSFASEVYVFFPGGFGTLDEFFEIVTLVQTNKIKRIPIIVYGKEYWEPILEVVKRILLHKYNAINKDDLDLITLVDSPEEAYEQILKSVKC